MDLVRSYEDGNHLYDAREDIVQCIKRVINKFPEDHLGIRVHLSFVEVYCIGTSFPWLFYAELNKAAKQFCVSLDSHEPLFAAEVISEKLCYVNGYILLPYLV